MTEGTLEERIAARKTKKTGALLAERVAAEFSAKPKKVVLKKTKPIDEALKNDEAVSIPAKPEKKERKLREAKAKLPLDDAIASVVSAKLDRAVKEATKDMVPKAEAAKQAEEAYQKGCADGEAKAKKDILASLKAK